MIRSTSFVAGITLAVAVLGAAAFYFLHEPVADLGVIAPVSPTASTAPDALRVPLAPAVPLSASEDAVGSPAVAPWSLSSSAASAPALPIAVDPARANAPSIAQIQSRLQAIAGSKKPDIAELDKVLAELEKNQGSSVIAGVDIGALRDNLARADRMQRIALEVQALSALAPGPDTTASLQAKVNEIQQLQSGMRAVTPTTSGVVTR